MPGTDPPAPLALRRDPHNRREWSIDGVGQVGRERLMSRAWYARPVTGPPLVLHSTGFWRRHYRALNSAGGAEGEAVTRRGGLVGTWRGRAFGVRREGFWRRTAVLHDDGGDLARLRWRTWGRKDQTIQPEGRLIDPGLLLFAVWAVQQRATEEAAASA